MNCLKFLVKHFLFLFNLVFEVAALAIIGIGGYGLHYLNNNDGVDKILSNLPVPVSVPNINFGINEDILEYVLIAVIVLGCVIFFVSFCGCCGSINENKCLLGSYSTVMVLLAGASIFLLFARSQYSDQFEDLVKDQLQDVFNTPQHPIEDKTINAIQYVGKCCGYQGPEFYKDTTFGDNIPQEVLDTLYDKLNITGIGLVSPSCCSTINLQKFLNDTQNYVINQFDCTANDVYKEGCLPKAMSILELIQKYSLIVFASIAGVTVLAFLFGIGFCCSIKKKDLKYDRY